MYLKWDEKNISDFSDANINSLYNEGYLFGRTGKGEIYQTRSLKIDLSKFELSSENRRVLKKTEGINLKTYPLPYEHYNWSIHKMGKDFYEHKFGPNVFSAGKIKELMTDEEKSNFNTVLTYQIPRPRPPLKGEGESNGANNFLPLLGGGEEGVLGYAICYSNPDLLHYCYPFYKLTINNEQLTIPNLGLGMMLRAILYAKKQGKKYVYLGSFQRPTDTYKLQFAGLEWFDGKKWQTDIKLLKNILD